MKKNKPTTLAAEPKAVFQPDFSAELTPQEIGFLREQLRGGTLGRAFAIAARRMPSSFVEGPVDDHYQTRCVARLNQLNGWVLHEAAILALVADKPPKVERPEETYPDNATIGSDWTKTVASDALRAKYSLQQPKKQ